MELNPRSLEEGTNLGGRYVIRRLLGHGATATAYEADDVVGGRICALKILHLSRTEERERAHARLQRELALVQRIRHPGICQIYSLHAEQGLLFLAMELVHGQILEDVIKQERRLEAPRAARIVDGVCQAMQAAHALGILHRDLKPSNIMLTPDDEARVLDFGYATGPDVRSLTRTGAWVGTLQYLAPELLKNERSTPRSEVYSLGVVLYVCLTGVEPYAGTTFGEVAAAKSFDAVAPPSGRAPAIDPSLDALVLAAMDPDPAKRPATAAEFGVKLRELRRALVGRGLRMEARKRPALGATLHTPTAEAPSGLGPVYSGALTAPEFSSEEPTSPGPTAPQDPRELCFSLRAQVIAKRRGLAIVDGDNTSLDALVRAGVMAMGTHSIDSACELFQSALSELEGMKLDGAFVGRKIARFDAAWRESGGMRGYARFAPVLESVMDAYDAGAFVEANLALNQAFAMLADLRDRGKG